MRTKPEVPGSRTARALLVLRPFNDFAEPGVIFIDRVNRMNNLAEQPDPC